MSGSAPLLQSPPFIALLSNVTHGGAMHDGVTESMASEQCGWCELNCSDRRVVRDQALRLLG
jgi:hypothetical protein